MAGKAERRGTTILFVSSVSLAILGGLATASDPVGTGWTVRIDPVRRVPVQVLAAFPEREGSACIVGQTFVGGFDAVGHEIWSAKNDDSTILAAGIDPVGNLYLVAHPAPWDGYYFRCYDPQGRRVWSSHFLFEDPNRLAHLSHVAAGADGVVAYGAGEWEVTAVKFDREGNLRWESWCGPDDLELDSDGLMIVAAVDAGANGSYGVVDGFCGEIGILHYSIDGELVWFRRDGSIVGAALAPAGGLYLVKREPLTGYATAIVTKRLDASGETVWERRFDAPAGTTCDACAVVSGSDGRIAIGGTLNRDLLTLVYDADGEPLWEAVHPAAVMDWLTGFQSLAFGPGGRVYAAGTTWLGPDGSEADAVVLIAYDESGREAWNLQRGTSDSPMRLSTILVDADDAATVVVERMGSRSCDEVPSSIFSFDPAGSERWQASCAVPVADEFWAVDAGQDADKNLYLVGTFSVCAEGLVAAKVTCDGQIAWVTEPLAYSGYHTSRTAIAVEADGSSYVAGQYEGNIRTVRLDEAGRRVWTADHRQPDYACEPRGICAAPDGGVYVVGIASIASQNAMKWVTLKYGADGRELWHTLHPPGRDIRWSAQPIMTCDSDGRVWITGPESGDSFVCYDAAGTLLFAAPRPFSLMDIAPGTEDDAYLCGWNGDMNAMVGRIDSAGLVRWIYTSFGDETGRWQASRIAVDGDGNLIVVGTKAPNNHAWVVAKLSASGRLLWQRDVELPLPMNERYPAGPFTVDSRGSIYVAGPVGGGTTAAALVVKVGAAGNHVWTHEESIPGCATDLRAIALGRTSDLLLAGTIRCSEDTLNPVVNAFQLIPEIVPEAPFARGDANASGAIDIADAVFTLSYLFAKGTPPNCTDAADANDSGTVDIADAITVLSHLFAHTGPLPAPFGSCGIDPTDDTLGCLSYPHCEAP